MPYHQISLGNFVFVPVQSKRSFFCDASIIFPVPLMQTLQWTGTVGVYL